jgi:hypothetical protein
VGFDRKEGVGGLVTQDWAGVICLSMTNSKLVPLGSSFGVTQLGSINTIFSLLWLDCQGWIASGSVKGGHQFTLGSTPLYVMESLPTDGQTGGKVLSPSPPFPLFIPKEFKQFTDVFSPQMNCTLPPHRAMDISINLKEGATPHLGACIICLVTNSSN